MSNPRSNPRTTPTTPRVTMGTTPRGTPSNTTVSVSTYLIIRRVTGGQDWLDAADAVTFKDARAILRLLLAKEAKANMRGLQEFRIVKRTTTVEVVQ